MVTKKKASKKISKKTTKKTSKKAIAEPKARVKPSITDDQAHEKLIRYIQSNNPDVDALDHLVAFAQDLGIEATNAEIANPGQIWEVYYLGQEMKASTAYNHSGDICIFVSEFGEILDETEGLILLNQVQ